MATIPDYADLHRLFYGNGQEAEYNFLSQAASAGVTAQTFLGMASGASAYGSGVTYRKGKLVTSAGSLYMCLVTGTIGVTPGTDPTKWSLLLAAPPVAGAQITSQSLAVGVANATTGTTVTDLSGMVIAPSTTSPIEIRVRGTVMLQQNAAANGDYYLALRVIDNSGTPNTEVISYVRAYLQSASNDKISVPINISFDVTPDSTARTYKLAYNLSAATIGATFWGLDGTATVGRQGALKISARYQ